MKENERRHLLLLVSLSFQKNKGISYSYFIIQIFPVRERALEYTQGGEGAPLDFAWGPLLLNIPVILFLPSYLPLFWNGDLHITAPVFWQSRKHLSLLGRFDVSEDGVSHLPGSSPWIGILLHLIAIAKGQRKMKYFKHFFSTIYFHRLKFMELEWLSS